jgi:hypothetical protein
MKRDERQKLLALTAEEMKKKIADLELEIMLARQDRRLQDKKVTDVKRPAKLMAQIKMLKAEIRRRQLEKV